MPTVEEVNYRMRKVDIEQMRQLVRTMIVLSRRLELVAEEAATDIRNLTDKIAEAVDRVDDALEAP